MKLKINDEKIYDISAENLSVNRKNPTKKFTVTDATNGYQMNRKNSNTYILTKVNSDTLDDDETKEYMEESVNTLIGILNYLDGEKFPDDSFYEYVQELSISKREINIKTFDKKKKYK